MTRPQYVRVLVAADVAQAESARLALLEDNINAIVTMEQSEGHPLIEVMVPVADAEEATRIIQEENWPRLA